MKKNDSENTACTRVFYGKKKKKKEKFRAPTTTKKKKHLVAMRGNRGPNKNSTVPDGKKPTREESPVNSKTRRGRR